MKRSLRQIWVGTVFLSVALATLVNASDTKVIEKHSKCEKKDWYLDFFERSTLGLSRCAGELICFISNGAYAKDPDDWQSNFQIGVGGYFYQESDHHAQGKFKLEKINVKGVLITYQSRFDHRSFGKNLITVDTCSIELPYSGSQKD